MTNTTSICLSHRSSATMISEREEDRGEDGNRKQNNALANSETTAKVTLSGQHHSLFNNYNDDDDD